LYSCWFCLSFWMLWFLAFELQL